MINISELEEIEPRDIPCPICGSPLSLLRRVHRETGELVIVVTCEFCDEYIGFAIKTGLTVEDLKKFIKPRKRPIKKGVAIHGLTY